MRGFSAAVVVVVLVGQAGCCPANLTLSESELLGLADNLTFARRCGGGVEVPILVGTKVCGPLVCAEGCSEDVGEVTGCFTHDVEGPASVADGHCFVVEGPGEIVWRHEPAACEAREELGFDLGADTFVFTGVTAEGLRAFDYYRGDEQIAAALDDEPGATEGSTLFAEPPLPEDFLPPPGERRHVLAGEAFAFATGLENDQSLVAWNPGEATLDAVDEDGSEAPLEFVTPAPSTPLVKVEPDAVATVRLQLHGSTLPVTTLVGVPETDLGSLALHVVWQTSESHPERVPAAVYAAVRDGDGVLVRAAPVAWEVVEGDVLVATGTSPEAEMGRSPWVTFADVCLPPSRRVGQRRATVRASLGALSREVELSWTRLPEPRDDLLADPDEGFVPDERCPEPACSCSQTGGEGAGSVGGLAWVTLLALFVGRRRRDR